MESILRELEQELSKRYSESNKEKVDTLCHALVENSTYPEDYEYSRKMVEYYGAHWHEYQEPLNCQHCGADLRNLDSGPPFKREIHVKCMYNSHTSYLECPDCGKEIKKCLF